jgi:hypothetical protein
MFLKSMSFAILGALLAAAGTALAAEYRPDDFLTLDLSKAVLSPTPLGPRNQFVQLPVTAKGDSKGGGKTENTHAARALVRPAHVVRSREKPAVVVAEKRRGAARTRLAHRHGNPLDAHAQAMDRRIQIWPCRSGGICTWKQMPKPDQ